MGRTEEALHAPAKNSKEESTPGPKTREPGGKWQVLGVRALALMVQQKQVGRSWLRFAPRMTCFLSTIRSVLNEILKLVLDLIVAGASEPDLVEILMSDSTKSEALAPLIVALAPA